MPKNLLSITDVSSNELRMLVNNTIKISQIENPQSLLLGKNVGVYFNRPSTRTKTSFTLAASNLGASVITYRPDDLQLTTGETIEDTAGVLGEYLDVLVIRCKETSEAKIFTVPPKMSVINALSDEEHPTQTIADLATIQEKFNQLEGRKVLFLGEGGNIATSFLLAASRIPQMELTFITPSKYGFKEQVIRQAKEFAQESSAKIFYHHNPQELPEQVDVVYTTRWRSMGEEKFDRKWLDNFKGFQVTKTLLERVSNSSTILMHDLPAERGAEVDYEVLEDERSAIYQQARNKYTSAKAILAWCCDTVF
ncbi:hypothetical protein OGM63_05830 [Plectonema radiosum NIES-515]|uniref:Ornithine carbamoyltransferase n=1 Tax=Plectonema radiosum NIES-515 TaxID=2986073 RepID=A0ABT3AVA2_9CYAN|nr:hypothetical protein [Plectonema radiosum]MCV3213049.1 hypothetical protein [Plectonema radiosum NIES-515]